MAPPDVPPTPCTLKKFPVHEQMSCRYFVPVAVEHTKGAGAVEKRTGSFFYKTNTSLPNRLVTQPTELLLHHQAISSEIWLPAMQSNCQLATGQPQFYLFKKKKRPSRICPASGAHIGSVVKPSKFFLKKKIFYWVTFY